MLKKIGLVMLALLAATRMGQGGEGIFYFLFAYSLFTSDWSGSNNKLWFIIIFHLPTKFLSKRPVITLQFIKMIMEALRFQFNPAHSWAMFVEKIRWRSVRMQIWQIDMSGWRVRVGWDFWGHAWRGGGLEKKFGKKIFFLVCHPNFFPKAPLIL